VLVPISSPDGYPGDPAWTSEGGDSQSGQPAAAFAFAASARSSGVAKLRGE